MNDPRPVPLTGTDIPAEVKAVRETDDLWRVYRREWVMLYVSTVPPQGTPLENCQRWFAANLDGRVYPQDVRYEPVGTGPHAVCRLMVAMPVMKAEWKTRELAERYVAGQGWTDAQLVARNSKADHELRGYGVRKLAGL